MTLFGYDQGVFGGVIVTDDFLETLGIVGKTSLQGTITAIYVSQLRLNHYRDIESRLLSVTVTPAAHVLTKSSAGHWLLFRSDWSVLHR